MSFKLNSWLYFYSYLVDENFQIGIQDYDCVLPDYYRMAYFA